MPSPLLPTHEVRDAVLQRIRRFEHEYDVVALFAVESGSRAWGFASPDSDYDVRFVYVHRQRAYLSVDPEAVSDCVPDLKRRPYDSPISLVRVPGQPEEVKLDVSGWDIRKALRLYRKSNPCITEWIRSPYFYLEYGNTRRKLLSLLHDYLDPRALFFHYAGLARRSYNSYLPPGRDLVPRKKYLYVVRGMLSALWVARTSTPPPIVFDELLPLIDDTRAAASIDHLLSEKRSGAELGIASRIAELDAFLLRGPLSPRDSHEMAARLAVYSVGPGPRAAYEPLNDVFENALLIPEASFH